MYTHIYSAGIYGECLQIENNNYKTEHVVNRGGTTTCRALEKSSHTKMSSLSQAPDVVIPLLPIRKHKHSQPPRSKRVTNVNKNRKGKYD